MATQQRGKRQNVALARGINAISANSLARTNGRRAPPRGNGGQGAGKKVSESSSLAAAATFTTRKWYPSEYVPKPLASAKTARNSKKPAKLRKSITPGTVLILLSGRFRGKRVVFLKQLPSGTLLITGPYKVNGVPLRRVNQAYVIATSTKVDLTDVELPEIDDSYFVKEKRKGGGGKEDAFFAQDSPVETAGVSEKRKQDQKAVDAAVMKKLGGDRYLTAYLNAKFSLSKNDRVHELRF